MKNFQNFIMNPNHKVVITFDGNVTLARIYDKNTVVSKGIATCCAEDEFDIKTGCEIALGRALEAMKSKQEWVVVNRKPRAGDYIRVLYKGYQFGDYGEVLRVSNVSSNDIVTIKMVDHPKCKAYWDKNGGWINDYWVYVPSEYEVVEPAPKKPEFRKVNRAPRVGDYFRVIHSLYPMEKPGDIYKISEVYGNVVGVRHSDHPAHKKLFKDDSLLTDDYIWCHNLNMNKLEILEKV